MSADFIFESRLRKLQISSLKPSALARVFRLDEATLVLTGEKDFACYMPEDGEFVPALTVGQNYLVDGIELVASGNNSGAEVINNNQIVAKKMASDLSAIQGLNRDTIISDVIDKCSSLHESANMLYHGPQAVVMVQSLAILSACAPDPKLDVSTMKPEIVQRLADPGSFRASLLHVANQMCNAFRDADKSMNKICACLIDLPDYFCATLEVVGQDNDVNAKKFLDRTILQIEDASEICRKEAKKSEVTFKEVLKDIDALSVAATKSRTTNEREQERLEQLRKEMEIKQAQKKADEERLEKEHKEAQELKKEALKEYREHIDKAADFSQLFLASLTDGIMDIAKLSMIATNPAAQFGYVANAVNASATADASKMSTPNAIQYAIESGLIGCLEKISSAMSTPEKINETIKSDFIKSLENFEKYSPSSTPEGTELFKMAQTIKNFLTNNNGVLENTAELEKTRDAIQHLVAVCARVREERQISAERNLPIKKSMVENIVQADRDRVRAAQAHLTAAEAKEEARRKELLENKKELTDILCQLKSIDTTTCDLVEIIRYLRLGMEYLGRVKTNWERLALFFTDIRTIIDDHLTRNVKNFITEAKEPVYRNLMLQSALTATGFCIQVANAADIYSAVSRNYIMPVIAGISEQMALEKDQARKRQKEVDIAFTNVESGVQKLIEEKQAHFKIKFSQKLGRYAHNMTKSVKINTIKSIKQ